MQIVRDEEVELAVVIVIDERAAGVIAHPILRKMNLRGDVLEAPPADVAIERVLSPVGDEQIGIAIVIVVAGADSLRPAFASKPERFGYVAKLAAALVVVHAAGRARSGGDEDIGQTVIVVVDKCDAAARRLDDELLRSAAAVRNRRRQSGLVAPRCGSRGFARRRSPLARQRESLFHFLSPSRFRKSVNSPSGGFCSLSSLRLFPLRIGLRVPRYGRPSSSCNARSHCAAEA